QHNSNSDKDSCRCFFYVINLERNSFYKVFGEVFYEFFRSINKDLKAFLYLYLCLFYNQFLNVGTVLTYELYKINSRRKIEVQYMLMLQFLRKNLLPLHIIKLHPIKFELTIDI